MNMNGNLVECVPNFSEGRDKSKVEAIVSSARSVPGVVILDVEMDADHNRSVLSFVAPAEAAVEAAFRAAKKASELIDLNHHKGEHPRMGAADVIPFVPVAGTGIEDCVALARKLGERIGRELEIPVYLYDHAAQRPERKDLAQVRKGQFEGLREEIGKNPDRAPDFGPNRIHPTAGATAVGAREQIINFNVNLDTSDLELGKAIAKKIRTSSGGLPALRAKEIFLVSRNQVQISTVLTNYKVTSLTIVLEGVASEARARGADIVGTEIVGLVPRQALDDFAIRGLKLENFNPKTQILENQLETLTLPSGTPLAHPTLPASTWQAAADRLAQAVAEPTATPGGGSVAAVSGQLGCALGEMVVGIAVKSKKITEEVRANLQQAGSNFTKWRKELARLMEEDAAAFDAVMAAYKLPKESPDRPAKLESALKLATEVPLKTARTSLSAFERFGSIQPIVPGTVGSDVNVGRHMCRAAVLGAIENVHINLPSIQDSAFRSKSEKEVQELRRLLTPPFRPA